MFKILYPHQRKYTVGYGRFLNLKKDKLLYIGTYFGFVKSIAHCKHLLLRLYVIFYLIFSHSSYV